MADGEITVNDRLLEAVRGKDLEAVRAILYTESADTAAEIEINKPDPETGKTLLHIVAEQANTEMAELLFQSPSGEVINRNAQDNSGNTAFHLAAASKEEGLVELLLDQGVNINATNNLGDTAFDVAKGTARDPELTGKANAQTEAQIGSWSTEAISRDTPGDGLVEDKDSDLRARVSAALDALPLNHAVSDEMYDAVLYTGKNGPEETAALEEIARRFGVDVIVVDEVEKGASREELGAALRESDERGVVGDGKFTGRPEINRSLDGGQDRGGRGGGRG